MDILLLTGTSAQIQHFNNLSIVKRFDFPFQIQFPHFINYSSQKRHDLLFYNSDSSRLGILLNNGEGSFYDPQFVATTANVTSITVGNLNNDGIDDIVVVHREQNQIEVLLSVKKDSTYSTLFYSVNFYPEKVIIGDINNDRIPDIISFGKLSSGISILLGKSKGNFDKPIVLFQDVPVYDCVLISLNGDQIADVALFNWLTNEIIIYLGTGKMKFSEQTVLSFSQDTVKTLLGDFNNDYLADLAIISEQNKILQILHGDGLGNFNFYQTMSISGMPHTLSSSFLHHSQWSDLISFNKEQNTFSIFPNRKDGGFFEEVIFGAPRQTTDMISGDVNGDGFSDILLIDSKQKNYSVIYNSQTKFAEMINSVSIAVGNQPSNLYVNDFNNDGKDEILITNHESSTLSLLLASDDYFYGQISIETPEKPMAVSLYAKNDSMLTLYSTHNEGPKVSLYTIKNSEKNDFTLVGEIEQYSITLPEKAVTVLPDITGAQKGISLYVFMSSAKNAIVFYQQVKGTRFLTKSLVPLIPSKIIFSTINDLNYDGRTDLLYIYSDATLKSNYLGITFNDETNEYKGKVFTIPLQDSLIKKASIFVEDFNGDQLKDCLLFSSPRNVLQLALGNKDNSFGKFEEIVLDTKIEQSEQIQLYDFNNDGILDIIVSNYGTESLFLFKGRGNGKFLPKKFITNILPESIFRCGDFNGDGVSDIVYTNPAGHTVSIIYGNNN